MNSLVSGNKASNGLYAHYATVNMLIMSLSAASKMYIIGFGTLVGFNGVPCLPERMTTFTVTHM